MSARRAPRPATAGLTGLTTALPGPVATLTGLVAALAGLAALLLGSTALAAPAVVRGTVTGEGGGVKAVVEYRELIPDPGPRGHGQIPSGPFNQTAERLTITRDGQQLYSQPVTSRWCKPCGLEEFPEAPAPLAVDDLEASGEPDVVLHMYTGGAHCCTIVQVFHLDPGTMTYQLAERDFGDPGAKLADVAGNGTLQLESADDRFAYAFAPFAYSGLPLQIFAFRDGAFVDVTRSYPAAIAADAARLLKGFRLERGKGLGNGLIAAWAADEELLGQDGLVRATLAWEAAHGRLRSREHYGPSNRAFVKALLRFLTKTGYR